MADKNKDVEYPEEVKEAIDEIGGLDRIKKAINSEEINQEVKLYRILSDKTRLTILKAIRQCDLCPCVIKVLMKISDSRLSYHLMVLEEAGLISSYKKKNWKIYKITEKGSSI
ncbi:MAG: metalloregulator ArsR/SmtB family transcription factor [Candidatus Bathyarchaeota archaeon]|jgi:ArsR family transcriptional regulator|nr:metalloregulator ArsR/SmtB family transcription factor [Candidatus Bathyarchaeota archaeon]